MVKVECRPMNAVLGLEKARNVLCDGSWRQPDLRILFVMLAYIMGQSCKNIPVLDLLNETFLQTFFSPKFRVP
jgi:hypothetical protein